MANWLHWHMVFCFPPCTHTAVSGAKHFAKKGLSKLVEAMEIINSCRVIAEQAGCPWMLEHPKSVIKSYWRAHNYRFDPFDYGGYLPLDDEHPEYPEYIAPRDAYPKETYLWCSDNFVMPDKKPVTPMTAENGFSDQFNKLGGKSEKTKRIRSATPRGFAKAVFVANYSPIKTGVDHAA